MAIQNSNIPPSFVNEVVKIVEVETIVRSNLESVSDVYSWKEEHRTQNGISDLLDNLEQSLCAVRLTLDEYRQHPRRDSFNKCYHSQRRRIGGLTPIGPNGNFFNIAFHIDSTPPLAIQGTNRYTSP
ncbi:hypothetical protein AVEN_202383-1 [Araneus ventricosus]|uniref:Uncharacterized protein n=1 Tax=Araneus ventricosus TaxID=182803 RepID=A0A4Y2MMH3_ARAVE|nr:hypothetical protein AVEN_202383-1 [Araneus ventricosus]